MKKHAGLIAVLLGILMFVPLGGGGTVTLIKIFGSLIGFALAIYALVHKQIVTGILGVLLNLVSVALVVFIAGSLTFFGAFFAGIAPAVFNAANHSSQNITLSTSSDDKLLTRKLKDKKAFLENIPENWTDLQSSSQSNLFKDKPLFHSWRHSDGTLYFAYTVRNEKKEIVQFNGFSGLKVASFEEVADKIFQEMQSTEKSMKVITKDTIRFMDKKNQSVSRPLLVVQHEQTGEIYLIAVIDGGVSKSDVFVLETPSMETAKSHRPFFKEHISSFAAKFD